MTELLDAASPADESVTAALRERARRLAEEPDAGDEGETLEVIVFRLQSESYAVESRHVREVYPLRNLTPVPCTPPFFLGVVNVRGELCPVIELRRLFALPDSGLTNASRAIILRKDDLDVGIVADVIVGMRRLGVDEILPPPAAMPDASAMLVRGVTKDRLVALDAEKILSHPAIIVNEQVEM